ncbi:flagellar basal body L-ring protein FlgH [Rhizobium sp. L1K21]|uniref:flagellar basal body L-ring protein FlgH n=1 Tax=Rhizobium sp. L1K21 TaxID=2954933 RepID=UPI002093A1C2|nr:flagellar basal body L-ring protein FlgH [Rhizobium sp. L1K21]MCO6187121.1 flagellar basal body L-ring protein FlgH [Rhizobium sp. L1K21]
MKKALSLLFSVAVLAGCQSQAINEIGKAPAMSPIGSGLRYGQTQAMAMYPKRPTQVASGYSLWNDNKAALFKDSRALNVGDILTVNIGINDNADFSNKTSRSRTNSGSIGGDLSASLGAASIPTLAVSGGNDTSTATDGTGTIKRSEKLTLLIAAVVTGILENGNLVISGSQEVRVNQELRILNVAGIVRPQDVDAENTISYDRIAEARISYGGRGRLMEVQQPPWGQQLIDQISPL